ncbi:hypothetical protein E2C01_038089 [Portunus trituberculatus]|uniref:Uncharacterized protein n=1 Tax=Portunus trituberculatus TaxID=210409 RepID=A0A5B7FGC1_PORTR|nr:hypothetical protein [Portunus trituberculatus]
MQGGSGRATLPANYNDEKDGAADDEEVCYSQVKHVSMASLISIPNTPTTTTTTTTTFLTETRGGCQAQGGTHL